MVSGRSWCRLNLLRRNILFFCYTPHIEILRLEDLSSKSQADQDMTKVTQVDQPPRERRGWRGRQVKTERARRDEGG
jgi:hypothetical protein